MRLDVFLTEKKLFDSRNKASEAISQGAISVNGKIIAKNSFLVEDGDNVEVVKETLKYVSRAGLKLEKAIEEFKINFKDKSILDIGASTGGFTDCSLQYGAKNVVAVDVGTKQLSHKLRVDNRVRSLENTNAVDLDEKYFDNADIITCDVSFVSGVYVFQKVCRHIKPGTLIVWLVKPQFECGKRVAQKYNGVLSNKNLALQIAENAVFTLQVFGFEKLGFIASPIRGGDGNSEYIAYLKKI